MTSSRAFSDGKRALIAYLMGGDPNPSFCYDAALSVIEGGADALELGIPFSDPIADGPTIQAASVRALSAGTKPADVLELAGELTKSVRVPIYVMTYLNPMLRMGLPAFARAASRSGVTGVIVPDLPVELSDEWLVAARAQSLETVFLVSPATSSSRIDRIVEKCSGFVYLVSVYGVTGERSSLPDYAQEFVSRVKNRVTIPVALGFGISRPETVKQAIKLGVDGVIVGSALVSRLANSERESALDELRSYTRELKAATLIA